jgi:hypothetical protein
LGTAGSTRSGCPFYKRYLLGRRSLLSGEVISTISATAAGWATRAIDLQLGPRVAFHRLEALDRGLMNTWRVRRRTVGEAVAAVAVTLCLGVAGTACNDITAPNNGVVTPPSTRSDTPLVGGDVLPPVTSAPDSTAGGTPRNESSPPTTTPEPIQHPPPTTPEPIRRPPPTTPEPIRRPPPTTPEPIRHPPTNVAGPSQHPTTLGPPGPPLFCGPSHPCPGPPSGPPHKRPAPSASRSPGIGTIRPPITPAKPDGRDR